MRPKFLLLDQTFLLLRSNVEFIPKTHYSVYRSCQEKLLTAGIEEKKRVANKKKNNHFQLLSEIKKHKFFKCVKILESKRLQNLQD